MFVREAINTMTLSTVGAANSCSTYLNGLLQSVQVYLGWNPAAAHTVRIFRSLSTGSTTLSLFAVSGTTVGSSQTWYEFFPRKPLQDSTVGSSNLGALMPIDGHLHIRIGTSSGFVGKVGTVIVSVV